MAGKDKLNPNLRKKFIVLALGLLTILIILLIVDINKPAQSTTIHSPTASTMDNPGTNQTPMIWINSTKTTGGWPLLENDIYNTMGLEFRTKENRPGVYVTYADGFEWNRKWRIFYTVTSIASSRVKNTDKNSKSIKSQTVTVIFPKVKTLKDRNPNIVGIISIDGIKSWPSKSVSPISSNTDGYANYAMLCSEVINETNKHTRFPLSLSEYIQSQGRDLWYISDMGAERQKNPSTTVIINFPYSHDWNGNVSDCGHTYYIEYDILPGTIQEFDIVTNTNWGLYDTSQVSLHVEITAPPNPTDMSKSELDKYGITKKGNGQYWIDSRNISINVS